MSSFLTPGRLSKSYKSHRLSSSTSSSTSPPITPPPFTPPHPSSIRSNPNTNCDTQNLSTLLGNNIRNGPRGDNTTMLFPPIRLGMGVDDTFTQNIQFREERDNSGQYDASPSHRSNSIPTASSSSSSSSSPFPPSSSSSSSLLSPSISSSLDDLLHRQKRRRQRNSSTTEDLLSVLNDKNNSNNYENTDMILKSNALSTTMDHDDDHLMESKQSSSSSPPLSYEILSLRHQVSTLQSQLLAEQQRVSTLTLSHSSALSNDSAHRKLLEGKMKFLYEEEKRSKGTIEEMRNEMFALMKNIHQLEDKEVTYKGEIQRLEKELTSQNKNHKLSPPTPPSSSSSSSPSISDLQSTILSLQSSLEHIQLTHSSLQSSHSILTQNHSQLQEDYSALQSQHKEIVKLHIEEEGQLRTLRHQLETYKSDRENIHIYKGKMAEFSALQASYRSLVEENKKLRLSVGNFELSEEKYLSEKMKCDRLEENLRKEMSNSAEFPHLKSKISHWNSILHSLSPSSSLDSPDDFISFITALQRDNITYQNTLSEQKISLSSLERKIFSLTMEMNSLQIENKKVKSAEENLRAQYDKMNGNYMREKKIRESYKRAIEAYEMESEREGNDDDNEDNENKRQRILLQNRIKELESLLESSSSSSTDSLEFREKISLLTTQLSSLQSTYDALLLDYQSLTSKMILHQGNGDGDDISMMEMKILHFKNNPMKEGKEAREMEKLEAMRRENEMLKIQIQKLQSNSSSSTSTLPTHSPPSTPSPPSSSSSSSLSPSDIQRIESECEKRLTRLKSAFKLRVDEFREFCYLLTGLKIEMMTAEKGKTFRLRHMYAESERDYMMVEMITAGGQQQLKVMETAYVQELPSHVTEMLSKMRSIPMFMAGITMELFGKQTKIH